MEYRIVVVDDEALSLTNARRILTEKGMKVDCLTSGKHLIKYRKKHTPDLILLDVLMPEMDGFETYRTIRELEESLGQGHTPIIFLTGENDSEVERRGLNEGASDFIRKPFDKDILLNRINNTIASRKLIESLTEEATTDKLTGFLNKESGADRISKMMIDMEGAFMILDLDSFKLVNDLYGHDMGDRVLRAFADIIRHNIRACDVVARIGGDEFAAFFQNVTEEVAVAAMVRRLNDQLIKESAALMGADFDIPIGISVGVVFVPAQGTEYQRVFQNADSALYRVKQNGRHGYEIYDPDINMGHAGEDLTIEIRRLTKLMEERSEGRNALILGREAFSNNYRFVMRHIKRYKERATKLLFSLVAKDGKADISEEVEKFGEVLQNTLWSSDLITQSRPGQFFMLLPELSEGDVPSVAGRVLNAWESLGYGETVDVEFVSETISYQDEQSEE